MPSERASEAYLLTIAAIIGGELDDKLDSLSESILRRRKAINQERFGEIEVGSLVRFNSKARPKYLQGILAVVLEKNQTRVVVSIGEDVGRFSKNTHITTGTGIIDLVGSQDMIDKLTKGSGT